MIAVDIPSALLFVGIIVLCATTAVTALSLPGIDWRARHRRSDDDTPIRYTIEQPILARRVVTGRPAALPRVAPTEMPPLIGLPAAPARQIAARPDGLPSTVDDAEALIARLVDDDPERLAELMMNWMKSDSGTPRRDRP